ncbi:unnamed protein product [Urochloa decumbens]|uniref:F-box/LRR-repeat protein 15/At3g58940/PEG3-like LRR domain-containing protein n=1 Tax=Urochloa decumbens TaxID=240449 RepID=A0ABC8ZHS9_9POAL
MQSGAAMKSGESIRLNYREYERWKYEKFVRFVNNMLLLRDRVDLNIFQLHFDSHHVVNCDDVRTWIGYAVKNNVKVLDVNLHRYDKTVLPRCIFTCRSLEELNLKMGKAPYKDYEHEGLVLPDIIIRLPSLKKLTLCDVEVDTFSLERIIARSPGLEDLHLINSAQHLELVESKVLKRLTIDGFLGRDEGLTIAAPYLIHFKCTGLPLQELTWRERPSLESAHIFASLSRSSFDGGLDFTGILLHAKSLALFGSGIKVMLEKELPTCSLFESLVTLAIGEWCLTDDLYVVLRFLQLSPSLEKLTLKHRMLNRATEGAEAKPISITGMTFQCPLLETVTIQCSKDDGEIQKTVDALVAIGISLEKIHVTFYEDIQKNLAERKRARQEGKTGRSILEERLKRRQDWVDDSHGISDSDSDGNEMEETLGYEYDHDDYF